MHLGERGFMQYLRQLNISKFLISMFINVRWKAKSMDEVCESQQLLTSTEEKIPADMIRQMAVTGHPTPHDLVCEIAHELRQY